MDAMDEGPLISYPDDSQRSNAFLLSHSVDAAVGAPENRKQLISKCTVLQELR